MDIPALKTFCRAVETGNLSTAAVAMHITKSVASRRIRALEDDLGVRLLRRTTRGVSTTPEGADFYERASRILDDLDDARQSIKGEEGALAGRLKVTAPRAFTDLVLGPIFGDFAAENPELDIELALSDSRTDVMAGGFDLALRITRELDDTSFISRKLAPIHNHVVATPAFIEKYGAPETPDDLSQLPCLYYANLSAAKAWRFMDGDDIVSVRVSGRLMTNSGEMQKQFALSHQGVAILPWFFVRDEVESGALVPLLEDYPVPPSYLFALYPERRHNPVRVKRLIDTLQARLKDDRFTSLL